jgi:hypothetical protein
MRAYPPSATTIQVRGSLFIADMRGVLALAMMQFSSEKHII